MSFLFCVFVANQKDYLVFQNVSVLKLRKANKEWGNNGKKKQTTREKRKGNVWEEKLAFSAVKSKKQNENKSLHGIYILTTRLFNYFHDAEKLFSQNFLRFLGRFFVNTLLNLRRTFSWDLPMFCIFFNGFKGYWFLYRKILQIQCKIT